jgi:hypothetical protein
MKRPVCRGTYVVVREREGRGPWNWGENKPKKKEAAIDSFITNVTVCTREFLK